MAKVYTLIFVVCAIVGALLASGCDYHFNVAGPTTTNTTTVTGTNTSTNDTRSDSTSSTEQEQGQEQSQTQVPPVDATPDDSIE